MSHYKECFLVDFVRKSYFELEKHKKIHLSVGTCYKRIFRENAKNT